MTDRRALVGAAAEAWAARHLEAAGAQVVLRNFRRRTGELDLVAIEGGVLMIVEVRLRARTDFGGADGSVDARKRQRILRTTRQLLQTQREFAKLRVRFDVVVIEPCAHGEPLEHATGTWRLRWLRHAFDADSRFL